MSWVATGLSIAGAAGSIMGGLSAGDAAKDAAKASMKAIEMARDESRRREMRDLERSLGDITARVAASNLQMSGTSKRYRQGFESEFMRESRWRDTKARMDMKTIRKGGQAVADSAMWQGIGGAMQFAGSAASSWPTK